ncbi:hypothetical protein P6F26_17495 [Roseibacterium sp. SDUM158017]|uniref:hypothetical protein n=1 Tax=Roseicyclus salinarum TaxID=3036773 RepID=UPI002414E626|nr:hypothetical protein [Roseibacterium sp. SDUM158017]MDG4650245.1 hypothetical protein [Roseibacterium sp. SDUM158017]
MPIVFHTSLELDLVYSSWSGDVDMDEWRESFARYRSDANYRAGRTKLNDLSEVSNLDAGFSSLWSALNRVNEHVRQHGVQTRIVLIVPDDVVYGLARIFLTLSQNAEGIGVELYRSRAEAFAALDLRAGSVAELMAAGDFLPYAPASDRIDST